MKLCQGSKGPDVRLCQEWLCLHGFGCAIDGDFGPATARQVGGFQAKTGVGAELGVVDDETWSALRAPLDRVSSLKEAPRDLRGAVVFLARQHLREHPREIGGPNMGPWVRFYMDGNEGPSWAWCLGMTMMIVRQAMGRANVTIPWLPKTYSCDFLALAAKEAKRLVSTPWAGDIFLVRKTDTDWVHAGIVIAIYDGVIETAEGNTSSTGSREGHEAIARVRSLHNLDFVQLSP